MADDDKKSESKDLTPYERRNVVDHAWQLSEKSEKSLDLFNSIQRTKHGLYASVPLYCQGNKCPYANVCPAVEYDIAPVGEQCTREISMIIDRVQGYCEQLGVEDHDMVDLSLIKELIDCEIMIMRCDSILAGEGDLIQEVTAGIAENGQEFKKPEIHKAVEMKERWMNARHKVLNQLNSTPKDKAKTDGAQSNIDPSSYAAKLVKMASEIDDKDKQQIIDVDAQPVEDEE